MNKDYPIAVLFDFDGVIMDTESQYTLFWDEKGKKHHHEIPNFGHHIKGQTLTQLYDQYFLQPDGLQPQITKELNEFETKMEFHFIPGVEAFMKDLRQRGVKMAIVTSSNDKKMSNAYRAHPELKDMVDCILTADCFTHSKPHPECFLKGAEMFQVPIENCIVFEDSFHGLEAGNRAGMKVIGLTTTNPASAILDKAHLVITDFVGFTYEKMIAVWEESH
ncbi:MAG: HAD family phosphatase [Bacteroidaceae bacterium]|nr:HAD family phosphatase [Bacteroidaceae bacterium]MBR5611546.1 HAD family phosphatase [Bacteroidaceae bacterium]